VQNDGIDVESEAKEGALVCGRVGFVINGISILDSDVVI
jgi:hypothetical protein